MNGLRALMPQTPKKERTDAAMGIAGMAMENQNIPPELKHAVEVKKAQDILQAADSQLAMERGQMQQPPQVVPRMRQQVNQRLQGQTMQGGLMDTLRSLRAGAQMRGGQSKRAMARKALGPMTPSRAPAGLAGIPSPNMASMANPRRAAQGGIMGFASGGMEQDATSTQKEAGMLDKMKRGLTGLFEGKAEEQPKTFDVEGRVIELLRLRKTADEEAKARIDEELSTFDPVTKAAAQMRMDKEGMRAGGMTGFDNGGEIRPSDLPPNATPEQMDAFYAGLPIPPRKPAGLSEFDALAQDTIVDLIQTDIDAGAMQAGARQAALTDTSDLEKARLAERQAAKELQEGRLTPEEIARRKRRAVFRGMRKGLGGASDEIAATEDAIFAERLGIKQEDIADLEKRIADRMAQGQSRFEAEQGARKDLQADRRTATTAAGALSQARMQAETTRRGQDIQEKVAKIYADRGRQPTNEAEYVKDYVQAVRDEARAEGKEDPRTDAQIRVEAVESYKTYTSQYNLTGRQAALDQDARELALKQAITFTDSLSRVTNDSPTARAFRELDEAGQFAEIQRYAEAFYQQFLPQASSAGSATPDPDRPDLGTFRRSGSGS